MFVLFSKTTATIGTEQSTGLSRSRKEELMSDIRIVKYQGQQIWQKNWENSGRPPGLWGSVQILHPQWFKYLLYWYIPVQQSASGSHLVPGTENSSLQLLLPQTREPAHCSSVSQSPRPSIHGSDSLQQLHLVPSTPSLLFVKLNSGFPLHLSTIDAKFRCTILLSGYIIFLFIRCYIIKNVQTIRDTTRVIITPVRSLILKMCFAAFWFTFCEVLALLVVFTDTCALPAWFLTSAT